MQTDKSATLSTHNTQTLFDPIPIADKATRCNPVATKQQEAGWNRMVRDLEHRKAKENHRKEVKTNGRNA